MSTIKVDTIATRTGSGNITVSNNIAGGGTISGTNLTASGTLGVTGATTLSSNVGVNGGTGGQIAANYSTASTTGLSLNDTNSGNLGGFLSFKSGGTLRGNIQNANNAGIHVNVGNGSVVFTQTGYVAANALDDYEEGTWSPVLDFSGGSTGISYSTQSGKYVKIGKVVYFSFRMYLSSKGSSTGHAHVSGFPFTVGGMPTGGVFQIIGARGWFGSSDEPIYLYVSDGGTRLAFYKNDWDGTANAAATFGDFANNSEIELTAFYFT